MTTHSMTDEELLTELKQRFDNNKQALYDLKILTKKLEEVNTKLQSSDEVKSHFLSNIKNEINNPLTAILGLSRQINSTGTRSPEMITSIAKTIFSEAFILDFQLRNIFAAAELESGNSAINVTMVNVKNMIRSMVDTFEGQIVAKKLKVFLAKETDSADDSDGEIFFKTDPEKLQLVIANLLSNAIEFNLEGGRIELKAANIDGKLNISVSDTGIGIDDSRTKHIFDRFQQIDTGLTKSHKGQGLGLSIIRAVIDMMEGAISVDSKKGKGTTISISLPEVETNGDADAFSMDGNEFLFEDGDVEAF